jgi:hypothetical protein
MLARKWRADMLTESELESCLHKRRLPRRDALLLIMAVEVESPKDVQTIKAIGRRAGLTEILKWNVSDNLGKVRGLAIRLPEGWLLTSDGRKHIAALDVFPHKKTPRVVNAVQDLHAAVAKIADKQVTEFLSEAVKCFEMGLNRACVVLSWVGAVALLYNHVITKHLSAFNAEAQRRDPKWKPASTADDLARMKESDFFDLIAAPPLSIIGKNLKEELKNNCLQLRNACGHPSSLAIGPNKVAAHLEILILNVFSKFI